MGMSGGRAEPGDGICWKGQVSEWVDGPLEGRERELGSRIYYFIFPYGLGFEGLV